MKLSKLSNKISLPILAGVFALPAVFSLLRQGFFTSDDGGWMIIRFSAFYSSFADGQFPVRFLKGLNFGYGYPVANFLYPGFMYLATPIHLLGFGFVDSIKILLIASFIFSGIFTFLWLKTLFGNLSSFLGAVLFVYTPYHLYDLYKRGSVGEIVSLTFVPLVLYGIEKKNYYIVSLSIFLLIISHNSMALLFLPIIIVYMLIRSKLDKKSYFGVGTGIALSSFFILPAVFELGYTYFKRTSISNPSEYFVGLDLIGFVSIILLVVSVLVYKIKSNGKTNLFKGLFLLFVTVSLASIFLSTSPSAFLWNTPIASLLQFPFRALALLLLANAFLGGLIIHSLKGKIQIAGFILFVVLIFYSSINLLRPSEFTNIPDSVYVTNPATTTVKNEYMPIWVKDFPNEQYKNKVEMLDGVGEAANLIEKSNLISFDINNNSSTKIRLNTVYFPGWKAYVNNSEVVINHENIKGVMDIAVQKGQKNVRFIFSETPLCLFADAISLLAVFVLISYPFLKFLKAEK